MKSLDFDFPIFFITMELNLMDNTFIYFIVGPGKGWHYVKNGTK